MFKDAILKLFIPTANPDDAKRFYRDILGFELLAEDGFAIEFNANGALLRVAIVNNFVPQSFTILGWNVPDIAKAVAILQGKGVKMEQYGLPGQDETGIWLSPGGSKVAWFKDYDGNVLSVTELT